MEKLVLLLSIVDVINIDKNVILQAINSGFSDFEDALQNYACLKHGRIDVIVTRNVKDFRKSEISVQTPKNFVDSKRINSANRK